MANFYTDNEDIKFHLGHPLMEKIVALKEQNYTQAEKYEEPPGIMKMLSIITIKYWKS